MKKLNKLYYLKIEIKELKDEIENLSEISSPSLSGMPHSGKLSNPPEQYFLKKEKLLKKLNKKLEKYVDVLEIDKDWNRGFSFANPTTMMDVAQVILVLQQYDGKGVNRKPRKGFGLMMIDKPALPGSKPKKTLCVDTIMERVVQVSMQGLWKELELVTRRLKTRSLRQTLMLMCDAQLIYQLNEEDRNELPGMGNFSDFGKIIEWGRRTKQKKHRSPDSLTMAQQRSIFEDFDRDTGLTITEENDDTRRRTDD